MTITLPEEARLYLEAQAARANLSLADYILRAALTASPEALTSRSVDETVREWLGRETGDPGTVSPGAVEQRKKDLEAALIEGLESGPPIAATPEFWEERQRALHDRAAKRNNEPA